MIDPEREKRVSYATIACLAPPKGLVAAPGTTNIFDSHYYAFQSGVGINARKLTSAANVVEKEVRR